MQLKVGGCDNNYRASVPGSVMLMGEHAVLHEKLALVCAINRRVTVELIPRSDRVINIDSTVLGKLRVSLDKLKIIEPFNFVLASIMQIKRKLLQQKLPCGFDLLIESDFSDQVGFGSSAAVTVATIVVLQQWLMGTVQEQRALLLFARSVIRQVQGFGSGADVAASVYGGIIAYRAEPLLVEKLQSLVPLPLVVFYSGKKVATKVVVAQVEQLRHQHQEVFASLDRAIECCVKDAIGAIKLADWRRLGELFNIHQGLHDAMGVSTPILAELIFTLRLNPNIYGAKISGSGLGDCVVGIGRLAVQKLAEKTKVAKVVDGEIKEIAVKVDEVGVIPIVNEI